MAQPKKLTKKTSTKRKTNKGGLKQTNLNFLSWKVLVPALVLFAGVGAYFMYATSASSYVFIKKNEQIKSDIEIKKVDGIAYHLIAKKKGAVAYPARTNISASEARKSNKICAHFRVFESDSINTDITIGQLINNKAVKSFKQALLRSTKSGNVCLSNPTASNSEIRVYGGRGGSTMGIDTIYGKQ